MRSFESCGAAVYTGCDTSTPKGLKTILLDGTPCSMRTFFIRWLGTITLSTLLRQFFKNSGRLESARAYVETRNLENTPLLSTRIMKESSTSGVSCTIDFINLGCLRAIKCRTQLILFGSGP